MIEVPSYVRNHIDDLERSLARARERREALRALPPCRETEDAIQANDLVAGSIERTLNAAKAEQPH